MELLKKREHVMYDQEKIKKMKNHELAVEAYYYSINNEMIGGISEKNATKTSVASSSPSNTVVT